MGPTSIYNKPSRRSPLYFMDYKKHEDERHIGYFCSVDSLMKFNIVVS